MSTGNNADGRNFGSRFDSLIIKVTRNLSPTYYCRFFVSQILIFVTNRLLYCHKALLVTERKTQ